MIDFKPIHQQIKSALTAHGLGTHAANYRTVDDAGEGIAYVAGLGKFGILPDGIVSFYPYCEDDPGITWDDAAHMGTSASVVVSEIAKGLTPEKVGL